MSSSAEPKGACHLYGTCSGKGPVARKSMSPLMTLASSSATSCGVRWSAMSVVQPGVLFCWFQTKAAEKSGSVSPPWYGVKVAGSSEPQLSGIAGSCACTCACPCE